MQWSHRLETNFVNYPPSSAKPGQYYFWKGQIRNWEFVYMYVLTTAIFSLQSSHLSTSTKTLQLYSLSVEFSLTLATPEIFNTHSLRLRVFRRLQNWYLRHGLYVQMFANNIGDSKIFLLKNQVFSSFNMLNHRENLRDSAKSYKYFSYNNVPK